MTAARSAWPSAVASVPRARRVEWTAERLSARDWAILEIVNRLRLVSGAQFEQLFFSSLAPRGRVVARGRTLRRLVRWDALVPLERRVGGSARGSASAVYALGTVGRRLVAEHLALTHAGVPGERTVRHTLAVSQLYADLVVGGRGSGAQVSAFEAEPACWWPNGFGGYVKPDAYAVLDSGSVREHWWVEVDRATEGLPTVRRKLIAYLDFFEHGQDGPGGVMPRVLVTVPNPRRLEAVREIAERLPDPAGRLFLVVLDREAMVHLFASLKE
jgi:hypothetical protein